ncbi:hypothetical protein Tco_0045591 [Tanacetum coccineum]
MVCNGRPCYKASWEAIGVFVAAEIQRKEPKEFLNTAYPLPLDMAYPVFCPIQRIHPNRLIRQQILLMILPVLQEAKNFGGIKKEQISWNDNEDCVDHIVKIIANRMVDLVKEISTNIGGEFSNLEDLEVLES